MIGDPLSIDALADELKDKNPKVRENAALSVTLFNHPKIIQALLELLKDFETRSRCSSSLHPRRNEGD